MMTIQISGQIMGGKNNICITRTGHRFPKPAWAKWRDKAVAEVRAQLPPNWKPIDAPTNVRLDYVCGDKRRRDFPAICDSVWHVLEKSGFVADDTHLWPVASTRRHDKQCPRMYITVL